MLKHIDEDQLKDDFGRPASPSYFDELSKNVEWYHKLLLNKPIKVILVMVIVAFIIPPLIFLFLYQNIYVDNFVNDGYSLGICSHSSSHRVQCSVESVTEYENNCAQYCCYDVEDQLCYHAIPSRYSYISNSTWSEAKILTPRVFHTPYNTSTPSRAEIKLHINEISSTHLNFILYDPTKTTYPNVGAKVTDTFFSYRIYYPEIYIEIFSKNESIEQPLLSTARGALVSSDDFWEWSFIISDDYLYGLGDFKLKPKIMYNMESESNAYPFVMGQRNGSFHGIYIQQTGPLEINHTESMVLTVKSLGGNELGVHFFYGPRPEDVIRQFREFIGESFEPPYWTLGIHFCRTLASSGDLTKALEDFYSFSDMALSNGIPYDSDCIADGIFDSINYQLNSTMMDNILIARDHLTDNSINFMPTLRPHIRVITSDSIYLAALESNILLVDPETNATYEGMLEDSRVVIPDYSTPTTTTWLSEAWRLFNVSDYFVLKDNWPHVDIDTNSECSFIHLYDSVLINKTVCESVPWNVVSPLTGKQHKDIHNDYGKDFVEAVRQVSGNLDGFMMTASSSAGTNAATFDQTVISSWEGMKNSFNRVLWAAMQGNYMHSVPVCGTHNTTADNIETVCVKWYLASTFLPIFVVQSNEIARHPFAFSGFANSIMRNALKMRYKLLPYMYSSLMEDMALLRPMFYEFWNDNSVYSLDEQFMVGKALMVAPSFQATSTVLVYIPESETMFDLWGGNEISRGEEGWIEIHTLENEITTLIRAGYIIPVQEEIYTTAVETRKQSKIKLIAALKCDALIESCYAEGSLFVSRNVTWSFTADERAIYINPWQDQFSNEVCLGDDLEGVPTPSTIIDVIRVYGLNATFNNIYTIYYEVQDLNINLCDYNETSIIEHAYTALNSYNIVQI